MQTLIFISSVVCILALIALAYYLLIRKGWILAWLKGSAGFLSIGAIIFAVFFLIDFSTYQQLRSEKNLATISVDALDHQLYDVSLIIGDQAEQRFTMRGDQWQLDVRLLSWAGPIAALGQKPLYRLDRFFGRYISLEQARFGERTIFDLNPKSSFDIWQWLYGSDLWLDANYGSAVFMPLENGAVYAVNLTDKGIVARPLNGIAEQVIKREW